MRGRSNDAEEEEAPPPLPSHGRRGKVWEGEGEVFGRGIAAR